MNESGDETEFVCVQIKMRYNCTSPNIECNLLATDIPDKV